MNEPNTPAQLPDSGPTVPRVHIGINVNAQPQAFAEIVADVFNTGVMAVVNAQGASWIAEARRRYFEAVAATPPNGD